MASYNYSAGSENLLPVGLPPEVLREVESIDTSLYYMAVTLLALYFRVLYLQNARKILVDSTLCPEAFNPASYPDTLTLQLVASLLTLYALIGFHRQTLEISTELAGTGDFDSNASLSVAVSTTSLAVGVARLAQLIIAENSSPSEQATDEEELLIPDT